MDSSIPRPADLAERVYSIRVDLYGEGEQGLAAIGAELAIPERTWSNYEAGVTMPAAVMIQFLVLTDANPSWLLNGIGTRYRIPTRAERPVVRKAARESDS